MARVTRECDVCVLVDDDHTPKQVGYCGMCDAYMCAPCRDDGVRRSKAWARRTMQRFKKGLGLGPKPMDGNSLDNEAVEVEDGR